MSMRTGFAVAGGAAAAIEAAAGLVAFAQLGPARISLYPLACAIASAAVTVVLWRLLAPPREGPSGEPDGGGGGGEPPWWPEFERDLRAYSRKPTAGRR